MVEICDMDEVTTKEEVLEAVLALGDLQAPGSSALERHTVVHKRPLFCSQRKQQGDCALRAPGRSCLRSSKSHGTSK